MNPLNPAAPQQSNGYIVAQQPNMYPQQPNMYPQQPNVYPQQPNVYPQQLNMYPQQPNVYPTTPSASDFVVTDEIRAMFGYARLIHVLAIIECVMYVISIVGLLLLYFPIIGIKMVTKWDKCETKTYATWRLIAFIFACIGCVASFGSGSFATILSNLISTALAGLWWNIADKASKILQKQTVVPQQLVQAYYTENVPCKWF